MAVLIDETTRVIYALPPLADNLKDGAEKIVKAVRG